MHACARGSPPSDFTGRGTRCTLHQNCAEHSDRLRPYRGAAGILGNTITGLMGG
jgi:hypothetical protein